MQMNIPLVILIGYGIVLSLLSWKATQIQKSGSGGKVLNYLLAGQKLPAILVAVMLTGLAVGGASTVGVAEQAYKVGLSAGWYNGAWGTGGIVVGLILAAKYRRMSQRTVPEMMGTAFGGSARLIGVVAQLLIMMTITSLQYVAGGAILASMLPDIFTLNTGMLASAVVFIGITLSGGYWASGLTNVVNVIIIYIGIFAALFYGFESLGGFEAVVQALPPEGTWFDPVSGIGVAIFAGWMAVMITMACTTQAVVQISLAAKDEKTARNGFIIGGLLTLPAGFLCAFFGIMAAAKFPDLANPALALPTIAASISPLVGGIFLAGLWAADVSTAVGLLMGCSTLLVQDVWKRMSAKTFSPSTELLISRLAVFLVSVCSLGLAMTVVGILRTITSALAITTSFTLLILANLYAPRLCKKSAGFWTILASLIVWGLWTYVPSTRIGPHLIYLEWIVCLIVFGLTYVLDSRPAAALLPPEASKPEVPGPAVSFD
ncbi:MAG: sodium:solute symporter family protein [Synergistaceae bacterium]|jgi:SSS family solute:Na+ symporter|nr:sodium:solute symporter family protein [Synergistaceae bacterium]